ncbi:MAG: glucose 1-dehydrogenase [Acidimicrobiia bacterium]|nr:glucose 1-dehydrogenase [Acidimicrobiia bacterium]
MGLLDDRVAIVTGAASGIGAATAKRFVAEGAKVLLADIQDEAGEELVTELGGNTAFLHTNVARETDVEAAVAEAVDRWGGLDVIHNNAGFVGVTGPLEDTTDQEWHETLDVLLSSVFYGTKHATPAMRERGGGSIINTASVCGLVAGIGAHAYTVAKHGVVGLTRSTALELAEYNIRANAVCPGYIATGLSAGRSVSEVDQDELQARLAKARAAMDNSQPLPRMGEPSDIAAAVTWLASDDSHWVTGTTQIVDGGLTVGKPWRKQPGAMAEKRPIRMYAPGSYE